MKDLQLNIPKDKLIAGVGVLTLLGGLYFAFGRNKKIRDKDLPPTQDGSSSGSSGSGYSGRTLSQAEINSIANTLEQAMTGPGTDETTMYQALSPLSGAELQSVFKAFGFRRYWWFGGTGYVGDKIDLFAWFRNELDSKELSKMASIWAKSGLRLV